MTNPTYKNWNKSFKYFPCLLLTGPKHPTKTQFIREFATDKAIFINLELPEERIKIENTPKEILNSRGELFLIEEIQHSPLLIDIILEYIHTPISKPSKFILTSSVALSVLENVGNKLSGIVAIFPFYPNSWKRAENKGSPFDIKLKNIPIKAEAEILDLLRLGYSSVAENKKEKFYSSWLQTYIERDLPKIRQIENISDFQFFLKKLTYYNAKSLNMAELARELNLSLNTVKAWVSVLQDSYVISLINPNTKDYGLRLKKTPNLYFQDTGLVAYLSEIKDNKILKKDPCLIGILEAFVVNELNRWFGQQGKAPVLHLWRPFNGNNAVLILETLQFIYVFDVSLKAKQNISEFTHYKQLQEIFNLQLVLYNIHLETTSYCLAENIYSLSMNWMLGW